MDKKNIAIELNEIFDNFNKNGIFKDKSLLQGEYTPIEIPHREKEMKQIAAILAPILREEKPSNLFIYGKTGTGKTLSIRYIQEELLRRRGQSNEFSLKMIYINCKLRKVSDTEYRLLTELIRKFEKEVPDTGLSTHVLYNKFIKVVDSKRQLIVLVLDEIDQTVKKISDEFLYNLTRINSELSLSKICFVGISNDVSFLDNIDPRVKSSLSEEEVIFESYNALQLQDILRIRSKEAFQEKKLSEGVLEKCAAIAASEHGDARKALDLLRVSGELAEREGKRKVGLEHVDLANEKMERDKIIEIIKSEPKQFQVVIYSIICLIEDRKKNKGGFQKVLVERETIPIFTGDVYDLYRKICKENRLEPLTQRRVGDIIQEFDMHGILNVRVISKGRWGRMREIKLAIGDEVIQKAKNLLEESLMI